VVVPDAASGIEAGLEAGASLGIVIGRTATRVALERAFDHVAGYTLVADLSVPHASVYRPSVRFRARDNFCVVGPALVAAHHVPTPDNLTISVRVVGRDTFTASTATSIRDVAQLIADVTDFMTLAPGDVLTLGVPHGSPVVHAGDEVTMSIDSWLPLNIAFVGASARASAGEQQ
jgi:5-oxopent-3-ene-1,2,5-tricarboxylate decarboxylase/2-hydroxyhepta-2,4-diene-1,7-dioate isomerase